MSIRIAVVDDHHVVRKGLIYFLETYHDFTIVGEAEDGEAALTLVEKVQPDIVLMDVIMPGINGIEATKKIKQKWPTVHVVVLSSSAERESVIPALQAGANGYQLKEVDPEMLAETIRAVCSGESRLHPKVTKHVLTRMNGDESEEEKRLRDLTNREKDVLRELAKGQSNKEIASELHISEKTVKTHVLNIFWKLDVHDRTQAALFAIKYGISEYDRF
ncbi:response regulator transcription factor [Halalkalibacterium halodurans]|uniref:response regulator n=1 Tax=Halalkalibacterium halodurans TaxID=86665 RepID=UPI001068A646|nr:response regulator transcription factor [Halalkalibacterium halodurans]TES57511.1 response regulator transcription factor [Halalkalibacterium halodurans]